LGRETQNYVYIEMVMNAGYKGKVVVEPGYITAPYNPFRVLTWQEKLLELEFKFYARWLEIGNVSREDGLADINEMMQAWYPGPYTVIESYISSRGVSGLKLEFKDPHQETIWLLKQ
jgi:hypothetical protein